MAINGVASLIYGVPDLDAATRFYQDFGLELDRRDDAGSDFSTPDGSTVLLRHIADPSLPENVLERPGVRETVWGVDTKENLDAMERRLAAAGTVSRDDAGTLHTADPLGIPLGFRVFERNLVPGEHVPTNTVDEIQRWNANRKWYKRARPRLIHHVGYTVPKARIDDVEAFYVEVLDFRVTDISRGLATFLLADGRQDHHSIFIMDSARVQAEGITWNHVAFGVENVDELMAGANELQRQGWSSFLGLGRHRISSAINYYANNPGGGDSEYLTDIDYVTDEWKPRVWDPRFGMMMWSAEVPDFMKHEPEWDWEILDRDPLPRFSEI